MFSTSNFLVFAFIIWTIDGFVINENSRGAVDDCLSWYNKQPDPQVHLKNTLTPPCRIAAFNTAVPGGWQVDPGCDAKKQPSNSTCGYHKGAHGCFRHSFKTTGPGAQACYNKAGNWISDVWLGAGTLDVETPLGSLIQQIRHYNADVKPYDNCCTAKGTTKETCDKYYQKRPPGQCQ
jgi:hypothetical protein